MEQARIFIAIGLSILVFLLWEVFFVEKKPMVMPEQEVVSTERHKKDTVPTQVPAVGDQEQPHKTDTPRIEIKPARTITVDAPLYQVQISEKGAVFTSFLLKQYRETINTDSPLLEMVDQKVPNGTVGLLFEQNSVSNLNNAYFQAESESDRIRVVSDPKKNYIYYCFR